MALSKAVAVEINNLVKKDEKAEEAIDSVLAYIMPDGWGFTGAVRNFAMVFVDSPNYLIEDVVNFYRKHTAGPKKSYKRFTAAKNFPNQSPKVERYICVGIAEATVNIINQGFRSSKLLKESIERAEFADRATGIAHAATRLIMKDGSKYIFDWHVTLNIDNPCIFKDTNWNNRIGGVTLEKFNGFP